MFREHFGMHSDPFKLGPSLRFLYGSKAHEETIAHLVYGIEQGEDFILISGDIGTGKTLAMHYLIEQISTSYVPLFINVTQLNSLEFLKLVLAEGGQAVAPGGDIADYLAQFKAYLTDIRRQTKKVLLLIDEAQNLDANTLEGIRLLTNLCQPGGQILQIILAGQPGLEKTINLPEMRQLQQRIRVHYRLECLDRKELEQYVIHRLKVAGCKKQLFKKQALNKIFEASHGVPRLVNFLASKALVAAFVDGAKMVDNQHVELEDVPLATVEPAQTTKPTNAGKAAAADFQQQAAEKPTQQTTESTADTAAAAKVDQLQPTPAHETEVPAAPPPIAEDTGTRRPARGAHWKRAVACVSVLVVAAIVYLLWFDNSGILTNLTSRIQAGSQSPAVANQIQNTDQPDTEPGLASAAQAADLPEANTDAEADQPSTDPVELETDQQSDPVTTDTEPVLEPAAVTAAWAVHVASFRQVNKANDFADKIISRGYPTFVETKVIHGQQWQRVYVGPYPDEDEATVIGQRIRNLNLASYFMVVHLDV